MYGTCYFYTNSTLNVVADSREAGVIGGVRPVAVVGSAELVPSGSFDSDNDITFEIRITAVGASSATAEWRYKEVGGAWTSFSVSSTASPTTLGLSVTVGWVYSDWSDFEVDDYWEFECFATYGGVNLLKNNRYQYWRTADSDLSATLTFEDDSSAADVIILQDHNILTGTMDVSRGATAGTLASIDTGISIAGNPFIYAISGGSGDYYQIDFTVTSASDNYIQLGTLAISQQFSLTYEPAWGSTFGRGYNITRNTNDYGVSQQYALSRNRTMSLQYPRMLSNTDVTTLYQIQDAVVDLDKGTIKPVWVRLFGDVALNSTYENYCIMAEWLNVGDLQTQFDNPSINSLTLEFREIGKPLRD